MFNVEDLNLSETETYTYDESEMYCEFLAGSSHLYEPRDDYTREQVLMAINETFETTGHTMPLWINAVRSIDSR